MNGTLSKRLGILVVALIATVVAITILMDTAPPPAPTASPAVSSAPAPTAARQEARTTKESPAHRPAAVRHWLIADQHVPKAESRAIPEELVVRLRPGDSIDALARAYGADVAGRMEAGNVYRLRFPNAELAAAARQAFGKEPSVASIESNYAIARPQIPQPLASNVPPPPALNLAPITADHPIAIGLVDTAVGAGGSGAEAFLLGSAVERETPTHATAVLAAMLDGLSAGIGERAASAVRVLPVDVYGDAEETTSYQVAQGILSAIEQGATIVNLSLGTSEPVQLLQDMIQEGDALGVVFVGAAGNVATDSPTYPAAYDPVLAVTSMTASGGVAEGVNYGSFVDAGAPGDIRFPYGDGWYLSKGTSISAGYISGLTAGLAERTGISVSEAADRVSGLMRVDTGASSK